MARMRTVKPEFWEDDTIGCLSREARLLFIATWNLADDEGLLRWTVSYIKANVFMYDDDIGVEQVKALMGEVAKADLVFPYVAGKARQQLACVVNFHKHQRVNRPQPGKLPPPSIQNGDVIQMYARRDGMTCHLCKGEIVTDHDRRREWPSLDHLTPRIQGGTDYPSNIKVSHASCNKARGDRSVETFTGSPVTRERNPSRNDSVNDSLPEGLKEKEGKGEVVVTPSAVRADAAPSAETTEQRVNRLTCVYTDQVKLSNFAAIRGVVKKAVKAHHTDAEIAKALQQLADENRAVTTDSLRYAIQGVPPSRNGTSHKPFSEDRERDYEASW